MTQVSTDNSLTIQQGTEEGTITQAELDSYSEIDNMSISEIISQRFHKKVNNITTPQEVANVIIKAPDSANDKTETEGSQTEQSEFTQKLSDIETNRMQYWGDIKTVKTNLWKKLHTMKDAMKDGVLNLAQLMSDSTVYLMGGAPADSDFLMLEEQGSSI